MVDELSQHQPQLPASDDEHPIDHRPPDGAHPPLRVGVGPRCPHRRAQHLDPRSGKDPIERHGELGIPITDQEPEPGDVLADSHNQVAGLLRHPLPHRMPRHPQQQGSGVL